MTIYIDKSIFEVIKKLMGEFYEGVDNLTAQYFDYCNDKTLDIYRSDIAEEKKATKLEYIKGEIQKQRERTLKIVNENFGFIEGETNDWLSAAPDTSFLQNISLIRSCGLKTSRQELEALLEKADGAYWSLKALEQLANENGFTLKYTDLERHNRIYNDMKSVAIGQIEYYCGNDVRCSIFKPKEDAPFWNTVKTKYFEDGSFDKDAKFLLDNVSSIRIDAQPLIDILDGKTGEQAENTESER